MELATIMKISDLIIILSIIFALFTFLFYGYHSQIEEKKVIREKGNFTIGIIIKKSATKGGMRRVYSEFVVQEKKYENKYNSVSQEFYNFHKLGDTIIINFLTLDLEKSMILEDIEYKTCFGIPPSNGWKELPNCK